MGGFRTRALIHILKQFMQILEEGVASTMVLHFQETLLAFGPFLSQFAGKMTHALGWEDSLEKGTATYSSILAWIIPWTEESMGVAKSWTQLSAFTSLHPRALSLRWK